MCGLRRRHSATGGRRTRRTLSPPCRRSQPQPMPHKVRQAAPRGRRVPKPRSAGRVQTRRRRSRDQRLRWPPSLTPPSPLPPPPVQSPRAVSPKQRAAQRQRSRSSQCHHCKRPSLLRRLARLPDERRPVRESRLQLGRVSLVQPSASPVPTCAPLGHRQARLWREPAVLQLTTPPTTPTQWLQRRRSRAPSGTLSSGPSIALSLRLSLEQAARPRSWLMLRATRAAQPWRPQRPAARLGAAPPAARMARSSPRQRPAVARRIPQRGASSAARPGLSPAPSAAASRRRSPPPRGPWRPPRHPRHPRP